MSNVGDLKTCTNKIHSDNGLLSFRARMTMRD